MVNFNGLISDNSEALKTDNRSFLYGDGIFETVKVIDGKILFFEDHYFRLMASMRIVRMSIPMQFTMEFLQDEILRTTKINQCLESARVRLTVFRDAAGFYAPISNEVGYVIQVMSLEQKDYVIDTSNYEVDLFRDFHVAKHLLSTLKTTSKMMNVVGSIYAKENDIQNCLLLNEDKNVVEALQGNLFMLTGKKLVTPPLSDGCLNGIMRKKVIEICRSGWEGIAFEEASISPFDLQKADELFITNVIQGIRPITKYRRKDYTMYFSARLVTQINEKIVRN